MTNISPQLIRKYLRGNCSEEERRMVDEWYSTFENRDDLLSSLSTEERRELQSMMFDQIKLRIQREDESAVQTPGRFITTPVRWASVAATVAATLLLSTFAYYLLMPRLERVAHGEAADTVVNATGTLMETVLPDSSIVLLYPRARLLSVAFDPDRREIWFEGKAFFDIRRDTTRSFAIRSGNVITRVLGTSFTINTDDVQQEIEVSVVTGEVSVESTVGNARVTLIPRERAIYRQLDNTLVKEPVAANTKEEIWEKVNLNFEDADIGTVVSVLNERFDVKIITLNDSLLACRIRADFTNQNLADILELLTKSIDAAYAINGKEITLSGEGCSNN